jgi:hypothetical protein
MLGIDTFVFGMDVVVFGMLGMKNSVEFRMLEICV